jgi:cysteinyl-tRNA synthetase
MHNGMLGMGGQEMHKSLGNDVSLKNVLDQWGHETLLLFFMTGHWRKPLDFSDETMAAAAARAGGFREVFRAPSQSAPEGAWERFEAALEDDFNTPDALAVLHEWRDHDLLRRALAVFGLESLGEQEEAPPEVVRLAEARGKARERQDWAEADRVRGELEAAGWEARDVAEPPGYRLVRRA